MVYTHLSTVLYVLAIFNPSDFSYRTVYHMNALVPIFYRFESSYANVLSRRSLLHYSNEDGKADGFLSSSKLGSPYTKAISDGILTMQESGDLRKLKTRWWKAPDQEECDVSLIRSFPFTVDRMLKCVDKESAEKELP